MAQVKIYGVSSHLEKVKVELSDTVHSNLVEALALAAEKKFQRFFALAPADFIFPAERSKHYTILEISLFEGRSEAAKKKLIRLLFERLEASCKIAPRDLEITLFEIPKSNWGIRGVPGNELALSYRVEV